MGSFNVRFKLTQENLSPLRKHARNPLSTSKILTLHACNSRNEFLRFYIQVLNVISMHIILLIRNQAFGPVQGVS